MRELQGIYKLHVPPQFILGVMIGPPTSERNVMAMKKRIRSILKKFTGRSDVVGTMSGTLESMSRRLMRAYDSHRMRVFSIDYPAL